MRYTLITRGQCIASRVNMYGKQAFYCHFIAFFLLLVLKKSSHFKYNTTVMRPIKYEFTIIWEDSTKVNFVSFKDKFVVNACSMDNLQLNSKQCNFCYACRFFLRNFILIVPSTVICIILGCISSKKQNKKHLINTTSFYHPKKSSKYTKRCELLIHNVNSHVLTGFRIGSSSMLYNQIQRNHIY